MELQNIKEQFDKFSDGIRVIILIARKKDHKDWDKSARKSILKKVITKNSEEFWQKIEEFKKIKDNSEDKLRIYSTVNARNLNNAIREFKRNQLDIDYADEKNRINFYADLKNRFVSALMKNKAESNFLIDYDKGEEKVGMKTLLGELYFKTEILKWYKTPNGFHIIVKPFNYTKFKYEDIKFGKDELLLLDY